MDNRDMLNKVINAWEHLMKYKYNMVFGRKGQRFVVDIIARKSDFCHLLGVHYLKDIPKDTFASNAEQIFDDIKNNVRGTFDLIVLSKNFNNIRNRIEAIINFEQFLESSNGNYYKFVMCTNYNYTKIKYDYLMIYEKDNDKYHYFLINTRMIQNEFKLMSSFIENNHDYSARQSKLTLLEINRIDENGILNLYKKEKVIK